MNIYLAKVRLRHSRYMSSTEVLEDTYRLVRAPTSDKAEEMVMKKLDRYDAYASCTEVVTCVILETIGQDEPVDEN